MLILEQSSSRGQNRPSIPPSLHPSIPPRAEGCAGLRLTPSGNGKAGASPKGCLELGGAAPSFPGIQNPPRGEEKRACVQVLYEHDTGYVVGDSKHLSWGA